MRMIEKVFSNLFFIKQLIRELASNVEIIINDIEDRKKEMTSVCPVCKNPKGDAYGTHWKGQIKLHYVKCSNCGTKYERAFVTTRKIK
tara:strand:+ start:387 stop:650 length:264 start_codon:yes stop_codon:yes gene_type:complete